MKINKTNPVAKNINKYNKPATHKDRKRAMKRGDRKHKNTQINDDAQQTDTSLRTDSAAKKPQNYKDPKTGKIKVRMVPAKRDVQVEKLSVSDGVGAWIKDFQQSDAPQFKNADAKKRKEMALAAYLDAKRSTKSESVTEDRQTSWNRVKNMDKGSLLTDKGRKQRLAYLKSKHDHYKAHGGDVHKVKKEIEKMNRKGVQEAGYKDPGNYALNDQMLVMSEGRQVTFNPKRDIEVAHFKTNPQVKVIAKKGKHGYNMFVWDEASGQGEALAKMIKPEDFDLILDRPYNKSKFKRAGGIVRTSNESIQEAGYKVPGNYASTINKKKARNTRKDGEKWSKADHDYLKKNTTKQEPEWNGKYEQVEVEKMQRFSDFSEESRDMDHYTARNKKKDGKKGATDHMYLDKKTSRLLGGKARRYGYTKESDQVGEEAQQVDELKKSTLQSYMKKSGKLPANRKGKDRMGSYYNAKDRIQGRFFTKNSPYDAVTGEISPKKYKAESVEQVDEASGKPDPKLPPVKVGDKFIHNDFTHVVHKVTPDAVHATRMRDKTTKTVHDHQYVQKKMAESVEQVDEQIKKMDRGEVTRHLQNYGYSQRNLPHLADRLTKITGKKHSAHKDDIYVNHKKDSAKFAEGYRVHATTHDGEKFVSGLHPNKKSASDQHYKMAKAKNRGKQAYKSIEIRKESADQIDEVSDDKLHNYIMAADRSSRLAKDKSKEALKLTAKAKTASSVRRAQKVANKNADKHTKRELGIQMAIRKQSGKAKVNATEQVQPVEEGKDPFKYGLRIGKSDIARKYLKRKAAEKQAAANKNDPGAVKKAYGPAVVDREKAKKKASARGVSSYPKMNYNRKLPEETQVDNISEASQALIKKIQQLAGGADKVPSGAAFRELKKRAQDELKKDKAAKKAQPVAKTTTKTAKGKTHTGSSDPAERNLIMQLRKAQDVDGNMDIRVSPTGKSIRLKKPQIDALLKRHDTLGKPRDKRMFRVMLTRQLRSKAK